MLLSVETANNNHPFLSLPDELLLEVNSYLDRVDLYFLRNTCRRFLLLIEKPTKTELREAADSRAGSEMGIALCRHCQRVRSPEDFNFHREPLPDSGLFPECLRCFAVPVWLVDREAAHATQVRWNACNDCFRPTLEYGDWLRNHDCPEELRRSSGQTVWIPEPPRTAPQQQIRRYRGPSSPKSIRR
jgi:F-box-like